MRARPCGWESTSARAAAGFPTSAGGGDSSLNIGALPAAVQHIVQAAYGDATGHIFLISAAIAVVGVIAAALLKPVTLRSSIDLPDAATSTAEAAAALDGAPLGDLTVTEQDKAPRPAHATRRR